MYGRFFGKLLLTASLCAVMAIPAFAEEPAAEQPAAEAPAPTPAAEAPAQAPVAEEPAAPAAKQSKHEGPALVLDDVVVTGTREKETKAETPLAVGGVKEKEVQETRPQHPAEIMGRVPGVYVNVTGGEGHMTSIRQPMTTSPVYLFLEDGIPTRSTGFFNHNALYEVNVPQSGGIEVVKGPGTALYGSDAIGGTVNVLTRPAPVNPELDVSLEMGGFGFWRTLVSAGGHGVRADVNVSHTDGWRDMTKFDRQSGTIRWDVESESGSRFKTVATYSNIDQQTAGTSQISLADYQNNPTVNYTPISYRKVKALRLSSAYEKESGDTLVSITPYVRSNSMDLLPNWSLSYDPQRSSGGNDSFGALAKYRVDLESLRARIIVGADFDYSPGRYDEDRLTVTKTGNIYTGYAVGAKSYDYTVAYQGLSPYAHTEFSPTENLRLTLGLRYDNMGYSYTNNLSTVTTGAKRRPANTNVNFTHFSPKAGLTYRFAESLSGFVSYRHAFRTPSESQLFRQGQAENTVDLKPVKVDSYDLGLRGEAGESFGWEITAYSMTKTDDIVSYTNTANNTRETLNAGETLHRGIETGITARLADTVGMEIAYSYAKHTYGNWSPKTGLNYDGKEQASAPSEIGNLRLNWRPAALGGGRVEAEWERLGSYWMDDDNTHKYPGHNLFHLRLSYKAGENLEFFGRVTNIADERYAMLSAYTAASGEQYAPGMPRTYSAGVEYRFK
ncbi:MAG: TonB-dependent receptor [Nitrospinae bacterium]|nr:TonB-dependent receptor [Nitrospinota bacterium]